jgi:hypothetical protein
VRYVFLSRVAEKGVLTIPKGHRSKIPADRKLEVAFNVGVSFV